MTSKPRALWSAARTHYFQISDFVPSIVCHTAGMARGQSIQDVCTHIRSTHSNLSLVLYINETWIIETQFMKSSILPFRYLNNTFSCKLWNISPKLKTLERKSHILKVSTHLMMSHTMMWVFCIFFFLKTILRILKKRQMHNHKLKLLELNCEYKKE